jgi:hypothetical protein
MRILTSPRTVKVFAPGVQSERNSPPPPVFGLKRHGDVSQGKTSWIQRRSTVIVYLPGTSADARGAVFAVGSASLILAIVWGVATVASSHGGLLLVVNDAAVAGALIIALAAAGGVFAREAERALVVDLGQSARPGLPVTTRLSRALADPDLEVRYFVPDVGWVDERGQEAAPPDESSRRTCVAAPGGGEVVLIHGRARGATPGWRGRRLLRLRSPSRQHASTPKYGCARVTSTRPADGCSSPSMTSGARSSSA